MVHNTQLSSSSTDPTYSDLTIIDLCTHYHCKKAFVILTIALVTRVAIVD